MPRIAVIIIGHYRSFDKNYEFLRKELETIDHDFYLHTWSTQNAITKSWHNILDQPSDLNIKQIDLLKSLDPHIEIQEQIFTSEELDDCVNKKPKKAIIYLFEALQKCLKRIKDPHQYNYILVTRYDILHNNLCLDKLKIRSDEICIGWNLGIGLRDSLMANDIIYAFKPHHITKFQIDFSEYMKKYSHDIRIAEEIYTLFFKENFKTLSREWEYNIEFSIIR